MGQRWFLRVGMPELRQEGGVAAVQAERVGWEGMAFWMNELVERKKGDRVRK